MAKVAAEHLPAIGDVPTISIALHEALSLTATVRDALPRFSIAANTITKRRKLNLIGEPSAEAKLLTDLQRCRAIRQARVTSNERMLFFYVTDCAAGAFQ